jgi:2-polyprenyl-3-methyl-5-hydroxy-6-metoxy-1,4-benzoquinol methylase
MKCPNCHTLNFKNFTRCPVCESEDIRLYRKRTFDVTTLTEEQIKITDSEYGKVWDLSQCTNCTHIFANPAPTADCIQSLYSRTEDPLYEEEAAGRGKNFKRILARLDRIHPERGILFDVGAATGILLNLALQQGWQIAGIEPSGWAVNVAKEKYGIDLYHGDFESAQLQDNDYTAVTLIDFIEHISHPVEALAKAFAILSPGGTVCLVTPDIESLAAKTAGGKWWHFRPGHLAYFTKQSIGHLLDRTGFSAIKIKRYSWTFSAHYLLSRKPKLGLLIRNSRLASFWKKIPIKLALRDSFEIYAKKEKTG